MFGITRQRMEGQTEIIIRSLFKSMFQLHLEYCLKFWLLHVKLDIIESWKDQKVSKLLQRMKKYFCSKTNKVGWVYRAECGAMKVSGSYEGIKGSK